jgi:hypothetical protein
MGPVEEVFVSVLRACAPHVEQQPWVRDKVDAVLQQMADVCLGISDGSAAGLVESFGSCAARVHVHDDGVCPNSGTKLRSLPLTAGASRACVTCVCVCVCTICACLCVTCLCVMCVCACVVVCRSVL